VNARNFQSASRPITLSVLLSAASGIAVAAHIRVDGFDNPLLHQFCGLSDGVLFEP
jgi:hypothetical protein